jgi:ureidoglycolate hydrolase
MAEEGQLDIFICEQEEGVNISANTVHPGVIATSLFKNRTIVNGNSHISRAILQSENFKMTILS